MRQMILLIVALLLLCPADASAADAPELPAFDSAAYCKARYGESYALERLCRDGEAEARAALLRPIEARILDYCAKRYESYALLRLCIEGEEEAKAALTED